MFDWDDLRIFLAVARHRRVAVAARALGVDATTIGRRLARLGLSLNAELFETIGGERRLTPRGEALFAHAETMESAAFAAIGEVAGGSSSLSGQVRLSVSEGFAGWLLVPSLPAFHAAHPHIRLDLITSSGFLSPSKREADMAVMLTRPQRGRVSVVKLGDYALRLYAARAYLDAHGSPAAREALGAHSLIGYVPEFALPELDYLDEIAPGLEPALRSTSIAIQHQLIASGAGIGVLPAFVGDRDARLAPVLAGEAEIRRSYWLVTHSDVRRLARIEAVAGWVRGCARGLA